MKKFSLLALIFVVWSSSDYGVAIKRSAAKRRIQKIEAAKRGTLKKPLHAIKRIRRNLGYLRKVPNKIIMTSSRPNEGFLVNTQKQRFPVIISTKKLGQGFFLGSFYDLDDWTRKYAYLK